MENKSVVTHVRDTLLYVLDHLDEYLPEAVLLDDSEFVVRIPGLSGCPTVEVDARMLTTGARETFKRRLAPTQSEA